MKPAWRKNLLQKRRQYIEIYSAGGTNCFVRWAFKHEIDDEEYKKQHRALILELWEKLAEREAKA